MHVRLFFLFPVFLLLTTAALGQSQDRYSFDDTDGDGENWRIVSYQDELQIDYSDAFGWNALTLDKNRSATLSGNLKLLSPQTNDIYAIELEREDEDQRMHSWKFWHMNQEHRKNALEIWEYWTGSDGNDCGSSDSSAMCSPRLSINQGGRIGIGTATPDDRLHVAEGGMKITNQGDGRNLLTLDTERHWVFEQYGSGAGTALQLRSVGGSGNKNFLVDTDGRVGIGTDAPREKLDVNGTTRTREVIVTQQNWPDYVFAPGYDLPSLAEVRAFISANGHLPGIPDAATVHRDGQHVGQTQAALLQKIEELTLYILAHEDAAEAQASRVETLDEENARLRARLDAQQKQIDWLMQQVRQDN